MAKKRIKSKPGLFGMVYHYDENGKYIGKSRPGLIDGTKVHFGEKGQRVGTSRPGLFWEEVHHDEKNDRYITSFPSVLNTIHRSNGRTVGATRPGFFDRSYTTVETDDEEYIEDFEGEEDFAEEDFFAELEDEDLDEDTPAEQEEEATEEVHQSNGKEKSAPPSTTKRIAKLAAGVFGILGIIGSTIIAIENMLSDSGFLITAVTLVLCYLLFGKLTLWGFRASKAK